MRRGDAAGLNNADQRITEDVEKFAFTVSELYSYTFKVTGCVLKSTSTAPLWTDAVGSGQEGNAQL